MTREIREPLHGDPLVDHGETKTSIMRNSVSRLGLFDALTFVRCSLQAHFPCVEELACASHNTKGLSDI
jgi:hypothetical protein